MNNLDMQLLLDRIQRGDVTPRYYRFQPDGTVMPIMAYTAKILETQGWIKIDFKTVFKHGLGSRRS